MPAGAPQRVNAHDFADPSLGKATPYGVYDVTANTGWVNVGTDADTGAFAVESIRRWWNSVGQQAYPSASRLLITADSVGPTCPCCGGRHACMVSWRSMWIFADAERRTVHPRWLDAATTGAALLVRTALE